MRSKKCTRGWLVVLAIAVGLLTACGTAIATREMQKQKESPVALWNDVEVQRINITKISETAVRVDMMYLIKLLKPDNYSFFFHFTDQTGKLVAQVDVPINLFSTGEVHWSHTVTIPPSVGKLKVVLGRYSPVNATRIATVNGLEQVEIGVID